MNSKVLISYIHSFSGTSRMKNLNIFDSVDTILPTESIPDLSKENQLKPLILENGKKFFYDSSHIYLFENNKLDCWFEASFEIDEIFSDELLNILYIKSDRHIRSVSYENAQQCYDVDLFDPYENVDIDADEVIINAALSPDKEHIVLLLKSGLVLTLSSNFKLIAQQDLFSLSDRGEKESVNVGWGKVETQFQGSAKGSTQLVPDHVDRG